MTKNWKNEEDPEDHLITEEVPKLGAIGTGSPAPLTRAPVPDEAPVFGRVHTATLATLAAIRISAQAATDALRMKAARGTTKDADEADRHLAELERLLILLKRHRR